MQSDTRLSQVAYNSSFQPDTSTPGGRFLMSAVYQNIQVLQGGTESAPLILPLLTPTVELVRALSKVEIVFKKKILGSTISTSNQIVSVGLSNVAGVTDVPPANVYYTAAVSSSPVLTPSSGLGGLDYTRDSIGAVVFYVPEFLNASGKATNCTQLNINNRAFPILTDGARVGLVAQRRNVAVSDSSIIRNYYYQITAYISAGATPSIFLETQVQPWTKSKYNYMFQDQNSLNLPPVTPTTPGVVVPVPCAGGEYIEIQYANESLPNGLMGAFGDVLSYYDSIQLSRHCFYTC